MKEEKNSLKKKLEDVLEPFCTAENFEMVDLEISGSGKETIVRVFLDKPGGISLDDCVYVSRQLGDLIDVYIETLENYRLEVSSPGPKRPLKKKEDFTRFAGSRVKIETRQLIQGRKKFTGILEMVKDDSVILDVDGVGVEISDQLIQKARLAGQ